MKFGGRCKGTPNKATSQTKEWIKELIQGNHSQFEKDLKALKPYERVQVLAGMLKYCIPTLQAINASVEYSKLSDEDLNRITDELLSSIEKE